MSLFLFNKNLHKSYINLLRMYYFDCTLMSLLLFNKNLHKSYINLLRMYSYLLVAKS